MKKIKSLLILAAVCVLGLRAQGQQVDLNNSCGGTYSQNFSGLPTAALGFTQGTSLNGWYHTGAANYRGSDNGTLTTNGIRNYHSVSSFDYSLGIYNTAQRFGVILRNTTGLPITSVTITYTGEQWRKSNNGGTPDKLDFAYLNNHNGADVAALTAGGYTQSDALDFIAPQNVSSLCNTSGVALDGNASANRKTMTATINLTTPLANGNYFILRWSDLVISTCGNHGLSIDDLSVSYTTQSQAPASISGPTTICDGVQTYRYTLSGGIANTDGITAVGPDGIPVTVTYTSPNTYFDFGPAAGPGVYTITNTVAPGPCTTGGKKTLTVTVVKAPEAGVLESSRNCNNITLTHVGGDGDVIYWEKSEDGGLWQPINNISNSLSVTLTPGVSYQFRAVVSRRNVQCQEVRTAPLAISGWSTPILTTSLVNRTCTAAGINVVSSQTGTLTISPDPNRVGTLYGVTGNVYQNLPFGTYIISFVDPTTGCSATKSVSISSGTMDAPVFRPEPYAVSRTSITPEWQAVLGATSYTLQYRRPGLTWTTITGITALRRSVTGLLCNTAYEFRVRAVCPSGTQTPYSLVQTNWTQPCLLIREGSDLTSNTDFSLYPNPNNGNFSLTFEGESGTNGQVSVLDLNGKTIAIQSFTANDGENTIRMNLDSVTGGIYMVRFQAGEVVKTQKIVVE